MADHQQTFETFMTRREDAARAYVRGDPAPLDAIVARSSPASFFAPTGRIVRGTPEVAETYKSDAILFGAEGESRFEIFECVADESLAYWSGLQHALVRIGDATEARPMRIRVTEVFRREDDEWKLVHRHADFLTEKLQGR